MITSLLTQLRQFILHFQHHRRARVLQQIHDLVVSKQRRSDPVHRDDVVPNL